MTRERTSPSIWIKALALTFVMLGGAPGCSDDPSSPGEPQDANVAVESANRETATIGSAGGSVSTTSNDGITYTLDIPAGAIPGEAEIAITPVSSIKNLPASGGLEGAVRLEPSGLTLLAPAVLTIGTPPTVSGTQRLIGFSYEGDASSFEWTGAIDGTTEIQVPVFHFSGAGAASAEEDDIHLYLQQLCSGPNTEYPFGNQIGICWPGSPVERREWFLQYARDYLASIVTPAVQGNLGFDLTSAVLEYVEWYFGCDYFAEEHNATDWAIVLGPEIDDVLEIIAQKLAEGIENEKARLCTQQDIEPLQTIFEYKYLADFVGLQDAAGLTEEAVLEGLCAEVVIEEKSLADPLPVGEDVSLDTRAALKINGQPVDAVFMFRIIPGGNGNILCAGGSSICEGRSNAQGEYTVVVRRTSEADVNLEIDAALMMPLFVPSDDGSGYALVVTPLVGYDLIIRGGAMVSGTMPETVAPGIPATLHVFVGEFDEFGNAEPIEGATLTFSAGGGTVNPTQAVTDQNGEAETEVTADDGASNVVVTISASKDGVDLASTTVTAQVVEAGIVIRERSSWAQAFFYNTDWPCTGEGEPFDSDETKGHSSLAANSDEFCENLLRITTTRSAFVNLISDPGLAADHNSASMMFQSSGSAYASVDACVDPFFCYDVRTDASVLFHIEFDVVGAPMNFEFDLAHQGTTTTPSSGSFTLTRQDGPGGAPISWVGPTSDVLTVGNLPPGFYVLNYSESTFVTASPGGSAQTATWNTEATLNIAPSPRGTTGGSE